MAPKKATAVHFVDSHPFPTSKREQELLRAEARSHAASVSHPKNRRYAAEETEQVETDASVQIVLSDRSSSADKSPPSAISATFPVAAPLILEPAQENARPWQRFNQKAQPFHRYRVSTQAPSKVTPREANIGRKRTEVNRDRDLQVVRQSSIPVYKGNTDPFGSSILPISALEHLLFRKLP